MYEPLPSDGSSIRLLRLLPNSRKRSNIECELFPANVADTENVPFEALSYTWGDATKTKSIKLNGTNFDATVNLEEGLRALRKPDQSRILWVDAVCINQKDVQEQSQQVQMMWSIYKAAESVVVWLGPEEQDSAEAMTSFATGANQERVKLLTTTKREKPENFKGYKWCGCNGGRYGLEPSRVGFQNLIGRAWFTRVWVLQEIAAAKEVVVACGHQLVSGENFYRETMCVSNHYNSFQKMIRKIMPAVELMSPEATILKKQSVPLLELIETYRSWNATKPVDKIYSLLNFSSDAHSEPTLQPDYSLSEYELACRIVRFVFPDCVILEQTDRSRAVTFEVEGHILGKINGKETGRAQGRTWPFDSSKLSNAPELAGMPFNTTIRDHVSGGAITILNERRLSWGYVCYLRGSPRPAVLELKDGVFHVVMMATPPPTIGKQREVLTGLKNSPHGWEEVLPLLAKETNSMNRFRLTWDPFRQPTEKEVSRYLPSPNDPGIQWEARLESMKEEALKKRAQGELEDVHTCHTQTGLRMLYWQEKKKIKAGTSEYTITIHEAAHSQLVGTLKLLLDANAPVDARDEKGLTALHYAAFGGNPDVVKALIQAKATVDVEHEKVGTPLAVAVSLKHPDVIRLLLLAGAGANPNGGSSASLFDRVVYGDIATIKTLLDSGADPNSAEEIQGMEGVTVLHMAAEMGHTDIVELLLDRGARVDAATSTDTHPLHQATMNGHDDVVIALVDAGANVNCQDDQGMTPLDFAVYRENFQTAEVIREFGGKHNILGMQEVTEADGIDNKMEEDTISAWKR